MKWRYASAIASAFADCRGKFRMLAYDDRQLTFEELLNTGKSVTIHCRNLQVLATELYKVHHGFTPELMNDIFKERNVTMQFYKKFKI